MTTPARAFAFLAATALVASCGDDGKTVGAFGEFTETIRFAGPSSEWNIAVHPDNVPDILALKGSLTCAWLDEAASSVALAYDGADAGSFTLTGTLVDGADELPYFTWSSKLSKSTPQELLDTVGVDPAAAQRIREIVLRDDNHFTVRMRLEAPEAPAETKVVVVQTLRVATPDGSCPAQ